MYLIFGYTRGRGRKNLAEREKNDTLCAMPIFSAISEKTIAALGEIKIIERIRLVLKNVSPQAPRGIGDDCAVLPVVPADFSVTGTRRLATTDSVIFGKHFDDSAAPENVGKKLILRNASDIAAMGGVPADAVLALVMSDDVDATWFDGFLRGVAEACTECGIELSGGDVAATPCARFFSATLALTGFAECPLLRTGAKIGDKIFVTGTLGGSILRKHFDFRPRVEEGRFLAALPAGTIHACIDVTDGLLKDHAAILPAGTHAEFDFSALPVSDDAERLQAAADAGKISPDFAAGTPLQHAFCDGEDYELLFSVEKEFAETLEKIWRERFPETRLSCIAEIVDGAENAELAKRLSADACAYEHFRSNIP